MSGQERRVLPKNLLECLSGSRFSIAGCRIGDAGARGLFGHPRLSKYIAQANDVVLRGNRIGDRGLAALADSPVAQHLTALDLSDCALTADGLVALERFPKLGVLDLSENALGPRGATTLARCTHRGGWTELDLSGTGLTSEGLAQLRGALRADHLNLTDCALDASLGEGGQDTLRPKGSLSLAGHPLGAAGAAALIRWGATPMQISLHFAQLDDDAMHRLAEAGTLDSSLYVDLRGNPLSADGLLRIRWRSNAIVKIPGASIDRSDLQRLKQTHPTVRFLWDHVEPGEALTCPYCGLLHDGSALRCPHCRADLTRDASTEVAADYEPELIDVCPHCDGGMPARSSRCGQCQSWTPRMPVR